ncbi:MAG: hypothetical protein IID32_02025 [Planctomycetes bacterium]|nr:hypothetical protein [Planctomycetota bacterium]
MTGRVILFDGKALFGDGADVVEAQSWRRETVELGFGGLDGVLSVDLGLRGRLLKQVGGLSAGSVGGLEAVIRGISDYIDGLSYVLRDQDGISYGNVRMDRFVLLGPIVSVNQVRCDYEIIYTQLSQ